MKKVLFLIMTCLLVMSSCQKHEGMLYSDPTAVYFRFYNSSCDSLIQSLAFSPNGENTINLDMCLLGKYLEEPKNFLLIVDEEQTTAVEGLHYKKLQPFYTFPRDTAYFSVPIVLIKGDEKLKSSEVVLTVRIKADELIPGYKDQQYVRIIFSAKITPPSGSENNRYDNLYNFIKLFGAYSQKKHEMICEYMGKALPDEKWALYYIVNKYSSKYPDWQDYYDCSQVLSDKCKVEEILDENNNRIEPWK